MNASPTTSDVRDGTSAAGWIGPIAGPALVGWCLVATTSADPYQQRPVLEATSPGLSLDRADNAIAELRRLSGLTWEQLSRLFGVTRRTLHFWASGRPMLPANEDRLHRLLAVFRRLGQGSADWNRTELLRVRGDGIRVFDLLAEARYGEALALVEEGAVAPQPPSTAVGAESWSERAPLQPERLVDALQDTVHEERGRHPSFPSTPIRRSR